MELYLELVKKALQNVESSYFELLTMGKPSVRVRERVFCYELYHQMRLLKFDGSVMLHAEIDKRGSPPFEDNPANPDFVFHVPGQMENNTLVMEVKGSLDIDGVCKDFQTLLDFTEKRAYRKGIFILYRHGFRELKSQIRDRFITEGLNNRPTMSNILVFTMPFPKHPCEVNQMSDLFD